MTRAVVLGVAVVPLVGPCKTSFLDWTSAVVVLLIGHFLHDLDHFLLLPSSCGLIVTREADLATTPGRDDHVHDYPDFYPAVLLTGDHSSLLCRGHKTAFGMLCTLGR